MDKINNESSIQGNKQRQNIELLRFVGMLLIMGHHLYHIGFEGLYTGYGCWVWVDFYFILTGAFTYRHFYQIHEGKCGDRALGYTIKKFKNFFAYTTFAVLFQYVMDHYPLFASGDIKSFIKSFAYAPYEILYLSSSGICWPHVAPIWFLSAMVIVLPAMVYVIQKAPEFWKVFSFVYPILYFGHRGVNTERAWPNDMLRALACMALGTMVYILAEYLATNFSNKKLHKIVFSIIEFLCVITAIYVSVWNKEFVNIMELLFFAVCVLMLSGVTYSSHITGGIFVLLGKLSMPMFIFHWGVGSVVCLITDDLKIRFWIYYIGTLVVAGIALLITSFCKRKKSLTVKKNI